MKTKISAIALLLLASTGAAYADPVVDAIVKARDCTEFTALKYALNGTGTETAENIAAAAFAKCADAWILAANLGADEVGATVPATLEPSLRTGIRLAAFSNLMKSFRETITKKTIEIVVKARPMGTSS